MPIVPSRRSISFICTLTAFLVATQLAHGATYGVRVRWTASAGPSVAGYRITVAATGGGALPVVDAGLPAPGTDGSLAAQVSGLDGRTDYQVTVKAYDTGSAESAASNAIGIGYAQVAARIDTDGDGLSDAAEDLNLNRALDPGETSALSADSDGDGVGDAADRCPGSAAGAGVNGSGCSCAQVTCNDGVACTSDSCSNGTCVATSTCGAGTTCNLATGACDTTPVGTPATTIWPSTATPAREDRGADNPVELGVKFRSDVAGYVTGIRFYKHALNTGTHVGNLWSATGARLASATFIAESASGWQQVTFSQPVAIAANTAYVASYHCPNGHFSFDVSYFGQGMYRPPLYAFANGEAWGNGVYAYGATSTYPAQTYASTNYWVDVVFSPSAPSTTPVTVTTSALPSGTVGSAYAAPLEASGGTPPYTWAITSGALPPGLTLSAANGVISGTPTASGTSTFTVRATGGAQSATRTLGITIAATPPPQSQTLTIWPSSAAPARADGGPDNPVELGVKFRSDVAGYVTGIRFYKHALNTGIHVGNLWSSTGTLLATATFSGESASGWQQVTFSSPVAIAANTTYVASYYCPNGHYSEDLNFFATQGVDRPPLHALANGVAGPNSVFGYGTTSRFPTQTWAAANYWVDVVVSTATPGFTAAFAGESAAGATAGVASRVGRGDANGDARDAAAVRQTDCGDDPAATRAGSRRAPALRRFSLTRDGDGYRLATVGRFPFPAGLDLGASTMVLSIEDGERRPLLEAALPGSALEAVRSGWRARASATAVDRLVVRRRGDRARVTLRARLPRSAVPDAGGVLRWRIEFGETCASTLDLVCTGNAHGRRCRER